MRKKIKSLEAAATGYGAERTWAQRTVHVIGTPGFLDEGCHPDTERNWPLQSVVVRLKFTSLYLVHDSVLKSVLVFPLLVFSPSLLSTPNRTQCLNIVANWLHSGSYYLSVSLAVVHFVTLKCTPLRMWWPTNSFFTKVKSDSVSVFIESWRDLKYQLMVLWNFLSVLNNKNMCK